jgi:hypothetical protein
VRHQDDIGLTTRREASSHLPHRHTRSIARLQQRFDYDDSVMKKSTETERRITRSAGRFPDAGDDAHEIRIMNNDSVHARYVHFDCSFISAIHSILVLEFTAFPLPNFLCGVSN